jgi:hypothetical protein
MSNDANQFDEQERTFSTAAVLGLMLMVGAAIAGGPLGMAAAVIGATLFGYAMCTAFWPANDGFTPRATCRPERDGADTPAEPEPEALRVLQALAPSPGRTWRERVTSAAEANTAGRGR